MRFSWYSIVYQTVVRGTGFQKKRRDHLEVSIIFKIGAVGILVSVLSQILNSTKRSPEKLTRKACSSLPLCFRTSFSTVLDRAVHL